MRYAATTMHLIILVYFDKDADGQTHPLPSNSIVFPLYVFLSPVYITRNTNCSKIWPDELCDEVELS